MKVVSNSSTLIALARINHIDILEKVVKKLIIPPAVYDDIVIKGAGRPGSAEIRQAKWIEKRNVSDQEMVRLNSILGLGESEAIALAKEIKADLIILDDDKARKVALSEGLRISGLLGVIGALVLRKISLSKTSEIMGLPAATKGKQVNRERK